jgi:hypothetical protein
MVHTLEQNFPTGNVGWALAGELIELLAGCAGQPDSIGRRVVRQVLIAAFPMRIHEVIEVKGH